MPELITNYEFMEQLIRRMENDQENGIPIEVPADIDRTPEGVRKHIEDYYISTNFLRRAALGDNFDAITTHREFHALLNFYELCREICDPSSRLDFSALSLVLALSFSHEPPEIHLN